MAIELNEIEDGKIIELQISDKLTDADFQRFAPRFEKLARQHGKIRLFIDMTQFRGWEAKAFWDEIKFDLKHLSDVEYLAVVGETKWQHLMATFCTPFVTAVVHYFDQAQINEARDWLQNQPSKRITAAPKQST